MTASDGLNATPLNALHREAGARMVDFAGWSMPLHYGSQIEEHHRVRRDAGMFDVSHMLAVDVRGGGAGEFLRYALANDVARLAPGKALYTCMLNEAGGILDDLIVYARPGGDYRLVVNAGTAAKDVEWLEHTLRERAAAATLHPRRDLAIVAVQGPNARYRLWAARLDLRAATEPLRNFEATEANGVFVGRTGYTGEDGFEMIVPAGDVEALWRALAGAGVAPVGLAARDTLRLEAGMNLYGQDMDESVTPHECGLSWTVDLKTDREFRGRAALERKSPRFALGGLVLEERGVMRTHQRVHTAAGEGEITSGGFSPTMNRSIALARVPVGVAAGTEATVQIRDRALPARIVKPPFVRNGKVLIQT